MNVTTTRFYRLAPLFALLFLLLAPFGYFGNSDTLLTLALIAGALGSLCALLNITVEITKDC